MNYNTLSQKLTKPLRFKLMDLALQLTGLGLKSSVIEDVSNDEETAQGFTVMREDGTTCGYFFAVITDAAVRDAKNTGAGILFKAEAPDGSLIMSYIPKNYSPDAFTADERELKARVESFDALRAARTLAIRAHAPIVGLGSNILPS